MGLTWGFSTYKPLVHAKITPVKYYKLSFEDRDSLRACFFPRCDAQIAPTSSGMLTRSFFPQSPRHKKAQIIDGERRLQVKWSSCQPCEKRRLTAVDVAENICQWISLNKTESLECTWNTKIVKSHGWEFQINLPMIPPLGNRIRHLLNHLRKIVVEFIDIT